MTLKPLLSVKNPLKESASMLQVLAMGVVVLGCGGKGDNCVGESCSRVTKSAASAAIGEEVGNTVDGTVDPAAQQSDVDSESGSFNVAELEPVVVVQPRSDVTVATKNYLQLNNTYSVMTGVATDHPNVLAEYNAIIMQLPTTSNPESLNGFNQIAQARLAFAYCDQYVENQYSMYRDLPNGEAIQMLLDNMVDVDIENNLAHEELYQHLVSIMGNEDQLISDGMTGSEDESGSEFSPMKREKLFELSCTALLASSYVSMI